MGAADEPSTRFFNFRVPKSPFWPSFGSRLRFSCCLRAASDRRHALIALISPGTPRITITRIML